MNTGKNYHVYAWTTIVMWALSHIWIRVALTHFSVFSLGFLRYFCASVTLILLGCFVKIPLPEKKDAPWFFLCGATGFFLYMICYNIGAKTTTVATSGVILSTAPVFTVLLSIVFLKEKITLIQWLAVGMEFVGILLITAYGTVFQINIGVLWLLLAALSLSVYNLVQKKLTTKYSALQSTTYSIFAGTALLAIFLKPSIVQLQTAPREPIINILLLGIFASAVAYATWAKAFEKAQNTAQVSNYMFLMPLMTGVMGFWFFDEIPTLSTWVGGACILLGSVLFQRYSRE